VKQAKIGACPQSQVGTTYPSRHTPTTPTVQFEKAPPDNLIKKEFPKQASNHEKFYKYHHTCSPQE